MKQKKVLSKNYFWFLAVVIIVGVLPLILYPFTTCYAVKDVYMSGNYSPLYLFHDNYLFSSEATFVDNLFFLTGIFPVFILLYVSVAIFIISLCRMRLRVMLSYIIPVILAAVFAYLQMKHLEWVLA